MKSLPFLISLAGRVILVLGAFFLSACRESAGEAGKGDSETMSATSIEEPAPPEEEEEAVDEVVDPPGGLAGSEEQIIELQREIDSQRQTVEDLQAAVDMERAKLEEDPEYDQSFLLEVMDEQQEIREAIETGQARLDELSRPKE